MYIDILKILVVTLFSTSLWAGTVHCRGINKNFPEGVKNALQSTVTILNVITLDKKPNGSVTRIKAIGSGFIADKNGYVVMSGHEITPLLIKKKNGKEMSHTLILFDSSCRAFTATVVALGGDENWGVDAILIKINNPPDNLVPIKRGGEETAVTGLEVFALGSPRGWNNTVYDGTVATPYLNNDDNKDKLLAHMFLDEGISGGALVNIEGVMVGTSQGKGFTHVGGARIPISVFVPVKKINQFLAKHNL